MKRPSKTQTMLGSMTVAAAMSGVGYIDANIENAEYREKIELLESRIPDVKIVKQPCPKTRKITKKPKVHPYQKEWIDWQLDGKGIKQ